MSSQHQIPTLGRLETVPIKSVWSSEPYAFDPWLSMPDNLQFLADALEIPGLELLSTQQSVGPFYADLVCQIIGTDQKVVIENQLDKADHRHLGQVLTYAPHLDAKVCVWVAAEICDEHRAAVDWLNRISNEAYAFFAVEVRAVRIGNSLPAPLFEVVAKPNEWARVVSEPHQNAELSEYSASNLQFWESFHEQLVEAGGAGRRINRPLKDANYWGPLTENSKAYISGWRSQSRNPHVGAFLGIYNPDAALVWELLEEQKSDLELEFGEPLDWSANKQRTVFKVVPKPLFSGTSPENWPAQRKWLIEKMVRLRKVFEKPVLDAIAAVDAQAIAPGT